MTRIDVKSARRYRALIGILCFVATQLLFSPANSAVSQEANLRAAVQAAVQHTADPEILALYQKHDFQPFWYGETQSEARISLFTELRRRPFYGIPDDQDCVALTKPGAVFWRGLADADVALSACLLRMRTSIALGVVPKETLGPDWFFNGSAPNLADDDLDDIRHAHIRDLLSRASPPSAEYAALQAALAFYMDIDAKGGWPASHSTSEILLDGTDPRASLLRDRLSVEGYISRDVIELEALRSAVRNFQTDHGLVPDSRIGKQTVAALNVTAADRVGQIAVNMERWRHVPRSFGSSYVEVNVADATLSVVQNAEKTVHMRTIVGDMRHPTPAFQATITAITFNPSWTVPSSIAMKEILPKLRRNPKYLLENEIEILDRPSDPFGLDVDWRHTPPSRFGYRLRQRPGSKNSLGLIKFEMANPFDVYLHDTPAKALFALPRRGLSHGCIRVESPQTLALRLLPNHSPEEIGEAIAKGTTTTMPLAQPLPVYVMYWTAFLGEDGHVNFRDDLYGRDTAIAHVLKYNYSPRPLAANQLINIDNCLSTS